MLVETNLHVHPVSNRRGGEGHSPRGCSPCAPGSSIRAPGSAARHADDRSSPYRASFVPAPDEQMLAEEARPLGCCSSDARSLHADQRSTWSCERRRGLSAWSREVGARLGAKWWPSFLRCSQLFAASRWPHLAVPHKDRYRAACPGSRVQPASLITRRAQLFLDRHDPHFTRRAKHRARGHHLGRRQMASGCMNQTSTTLTRALLIRFAHGAGSDPAVAMTVGGGAKRHVTPTGGHAPVMCGPA